jgi:hypothetical protein
MMKTIITNFFEDTLNQGLGGYHGLVFCATYPMQFRYLGSLEYSDGVTVEEVTKQVDQWNKGMLADGQLYTRRYVTLPRHT